MNNLQFKYILLHIFFWLTYCCVYGYLAVFLRFCGMSNSLIGVTSGATCALTILTSPYLTGLIGSIRGLTIKKMMLATYLGMVVSWAAMIYLPLPRMVLMLAFIVLGNLMAANVPLLTMICMDYLTDGLQINFGLARGMGSVSYATTAVVLGLLIEKTNPTALAYLFVGAAVLLFMVLFSMPDARIKKTGSSQEKISAIQFLMTYRTYMLILFSFTLAFAAATSLATYLIDIVESLGGSTSLYGGIGASFYGAPALF